MEQLKLHLGCGDRLLDGWVNIDLQQKEGVVSCDLRQPLPFDTDTILYIYSEHLIEHLNRYDGANLLRECYRVLFKDGARIRISTPDLAYLVDGYMKGDLTRYSKVGWMPKSKAQMLNEGMHEWGHQFLYDEQELITLLHETGFKEITRLRGRGSGFLAGIESRPDCNDLIIEATI